MGKLTTMDLIALGVMIPCAANAWHWFGFLPYRWELALPMAIGIVLAGSWYYSARAALTAKKSAMQVTNTGSEFGMRMVSVVIVATSLFTSVMNMTESNHADIQNQKNAVVETEQGRSLNNEIILAQNEKIQLSNDGKAGSERYLDLTESIKQMRAELKASESSSREKALSVFGGASIGIAINAILVALLNEALLWGFATVRGRLLALDDLPDKKSGSGDEFYEIEPIEYTASTVAKKSMAMPEVKLRHPIRSNPPATGKTAAKKHEALNRAREVCRSGAIEGEPTYSKIKTAANITSESIVSWVFKRLAEEGYLDVRDKSAARKRYTWGKSAKAA